MILHRWIAVSVDTDTVKRTVARCSAFRSVVLSVVNGLEEVQVPVKSIMGLIEGVDEIDETENHDRTKDILRGFCHLFVLLLNRK